jgi:hypothetical protein
MTNSQPIRLVRSVIVQIYVGAILTAATRSDTSTTRRVPSTVDSMFPPPEFGAFGINPLATNHQQLL